MQKVVGSSPIIRSRKGPAQAGFSVPPRTLAKQPNERDADQPRDLAREQEPDSADEFPAQHDNVVDLRNPGPDIGSQFRDGGHRAERDEQTGPQRRRRNGCQESCSLEISRSTSRARRATRSAWINRSVSMSCSAAGTPADHRPARRRAQGMTFYRSDRPHPPKSGVERASDERARSAS